MQQKPRLTQTPNFFCHVTNAVSTALSRQVNILAILCHTAVNSLPLNNAMVARTPQTWTLQSWLKARQCAHKMGHPLVPADDAAICACHALHGLQGNLGMTQPA